MKAAIAEVHYLVEQVALRFARKPRVVLVLAGPAFGGVTRQARLCAFGDSVRWCKRDSRDTASRDDEDDQRQSIHGYGITGNGRKK